MLVAFSGFKTAGKDEAAKVLIEEYGFTKVALADPVRALAYAINPLIDMSALGANMRLRTLIDTYGWDFCKNTYPEVRRLMQAVGTEGGRILFGENFWIDQLKATIPDLFDSESRYVLTDARFLNEGYFVVQNGGILFWIDRPGLESDGHASESGELRDVATYLLHNDSTVEELHEDIRFAMFMNNLSKERV